MVDPIKLGCTRTECTVWSFHELGWCVRRIADELGIAPEAVRGIIVDIWRLDKERAVRW